MANVSISLPFVIIHMGFLLSDLLVKLYSLPELGPIVRSLGAEGIQIRRPASYEKSRVLKYVSQTFDDGWSSECDVSFSHHPVSCFVATQAGQLIGFACYECTRKNFFGPTGVSVSARGKGVGKALCLSCLHAMAQAGYAYGIIGGSSADEFYVQTVGAVVIEGSEPGIYLDPLTSESPQ